jgi:hypothetical protein
VGKVTASIDTARFRGAIAKTVRVTANDPAHTVVTLELRALVVTTIDVLPTDNPMIRMAFGESKTTELTLQATDKQPFDVLTVTADPSVSVAVRAAPGEPSAKPRRRKGAAAVAGGSSRYLVAITPKSATVVGQSIAHVTLTTDRKKAEKIPIRAVVTVVGPVQVMPAQIMLKPSAEPFSATILVRKPTGDPLRILGVETADRDFTATLTPVKEGREYRVVVTYAGKTGRGMVRSSLTVKTSEPAQPAIVIPMVGAL